MKAIPTEYKGIFFRSKLEASYAKTLDELKIVWVYEHNGYDIRGVKYLPDFWLPEIRTFLEVKGPFIPGAEKARDLAVVLNPEEEVWFPNVLVVIGNELGELRLADDDSHVSLAVCERCKGYWFMPDTGSYACRNCGIYDGDHHIIRTFDILTLSQLQV
ncbi:MAG: hypothetical protein ABSH06_23170 [Thermodesulfobacteriota bacterium]